MFDLLTDSDTKYTWISWKFSDWGYFIAYCTRSGGFFQTFPVTPPTGVNKTWEITVTTAYINIKYNTLEVLHFVFDNAYDDRCTTVKRKIAAKIRFWANSENATIMFNADQKERHQNKK